VIDMSEASTWAPHDIDLERPSVARMYDYLLGGAHNFAVDRAAADRAVTALPWLPLVAYANRDFLRRAVRYMAAEGISQFLDLGSGIPTVGNVHEIAGQANPATRTVYVDIDPVAVAHARALLRGNQSAAAILADLREPAQVLADPAVNEMIDWSRPIGVLMVAVLHFVPDQENPADTISTYRQHMAPGSYLAISHASRDGQPADLDEAIDEAAQAYEDTGTGLTFRTEAELARLVHGFDLVAPGIVAVPDWRPEPDPDAEGLDRWRYGLAGVGHLPATSPRHTLTPPANTVSWPTSRTALAGSGGRLHPHGVSAWSSGAPDRMTPALDCSH
jgi:SAM-dependent methyltransferase